MEDRLVRAGVFGSLAGTFVLAVDVLSFNVLHFAKSSWLAAVGYLILGKAMRGVPDTLVGASGHLLFTGMLGAIFPLLIVPEPSDVNYTLRGVGLGASAWFTTLSLGTIFRVAPLHIVAWQTAVVQLLAVVMWGGLFGWAYGQSESEVSASPVTVSDQAAGKDPARDSRAPSDQTPAPATDKSVGTAKDGQPKRAEVSPALHREFVSVVRELHRIEDALRMGQMDAEAPDEPHEEPESWAARIRHPVELEDLHRSADSEQKDPRRNPH